MEKIGFQHSLGPGRGTKSSRFRKLPAPCHLTLSIVLLLAFLQAPFSHAATVFFSDTQGNPAISVEPGTDFDIVLNVSGITSLAGYKARITAAGPVSFIAGATHGTWFAAGHSLCGPYEATAAPPDYHTAMLISPASISGSGALVVFHLHADEEGTAGIDVDPLMFVLGDTNATPIPVDLPSTITITIETGGGDSLLGGTGGETSLSAIAAEASTAATATEPALAIDLSSGEGGSLLLGDPACDECFIEGNANHDTSVDVLDLICVRNRMSPDPVADPEAFRCDVNADGHVNILDLIYVRNRLDTATVPLPLVATYGSTTVQTMFTEPLDTLHVDTEADGETSVLLAIGNWFAAEDLDIALDCSCGQNCCTLAYPPASYGKAQLTLNHLPDPEAPETHSVTVTVTPHNLTACGRAIMVVFSDIGIPEAGGQNGCVFAPVGTSKTVNALIGGQTPAQGTFTWKAAPPVVITPTEESNVVDLRSPDAGVFNVEVTFTLGELVSVRSFRFVAFEVQFVRAVRPDATQTSALDIFTTPGTLTLTARVYPGFVPVTAWDWSGTQRIDPDPAYTLEFGYQDAFSFAIEAGEPGSAALTINGYADDVEFEVRPQAVTPFGTAVIREAFRPHVILPVFAAYVSGTDGSYTYWGTDGQRADTRVPCSGHDTSPASPLYFGAPAVVTVHAALSAMRPTIDVAWEWEVSEGTADILPDGSTGWLVLTQTTSLAVTFTAVVNGVRLEPCTLRANVWAIDTPGGTDTFYVGKNEINSERFLEFGIPTTGMPPDATLDSSLGEIVSQGIEQDSLVTRIEFDPLDFGLRYHALLSTGSTDQIYSNYPAVRPVVFALYRLMDLHEWHDFHLHTAWDCQTGLYTYAGAARAIELQVEPAFNPGDVEFEYSSILADSEEPGTCSLESNGSSATLTVDGRSAVAFEDLFEIAWVDTIAGPVSPPYSASVAARTERFDQNGGIEEHCGDCVHGVTSHEVTHDEIFLPWAGAGTSFEVPLPAGDYNPAISTILWHEGHWTRWSHDCASEPYFYPSGPGLWEIFVKASEPVGESCGQPLVNRYCAHHRLIVYAADAVAPYGPPYYVAVNDDDDNCNGIPDLNDAAVPGDNDLLWFRVTFTPPLSFLRSRGAALEVETNKVRLYVTPDKSVPFDANIPAHLADQLYIEAISPSSQADDASFTLRLTAPSAAPFEKTVSLTSFQVLAVEIDDPEVEGADFRTCDGAIFGTVAPTLRVHYAPAIPQITDSLGIRVGNRNLRPYLTFDQGYASGIIPAPGEEDTFGYYAGRNETTVVLGAGSLTFHRDYVSFHYIISDDPVPGGGMQFLQHEDMLSNLVQQGSDYIVDGLVVAQFEPEITDARLSQIIRGENLLVVALQRYYQVLVVRARSYQDQQAIRDYLAALPEEPYVFIPGAYNYDPATGDFEWERAALDSEVNLAAFVNVPPTPPDYFVSHPTFNTPIFLMHEPSADAHVAGGDSQNTNFGTEPLLEIDSAQDPGAVRKLAYMAFDLREVRKLVGTVELYFILMAESADSVSLYALDDDAWQEDTITYATAPNLNPDGTLDPNGIQLITQIALDEQDPIANRQFTIDVTDFVAAQFQGDKIASFILYSEADGLISIASREYTGCEPFLYFDPPELPEDSEFVAGASFTNVNDEKIKAVFDPLKGTWYNVETLRSAGLLETRLKDGEAVDFIDWSKVDESVPGLSAPDQATLFLQTHISFSSDPMISKFIDDQARLTMGLMEYTDAGDITFSVLKGDFKGAGFAVGAAVIPGLSRKTILKGVGKLGTITGVTKTRAFRIGEAGLRRVMKKLNLKKAQVMVKGRLRTWKPRKWGFDAVFEKGDNLVLAKMDDTVVLDPNTFDLIIGEAKGGTSRLGGVWRRFVGGDKRYLQQMGSDGDWVRDVIRRMRQHGDDVDRAMADKLEQALSNGRLQGLIASTPIKDAVVQETKVVQVLFDP